MTLNRIAAAAAGVMQETNFLSIARVGAVIRQRREDQWLSQGEVAEIIGLSQAQYWRIEAGESRIPFSQFQKLAVLLRMSDRDILVLVRGRE